MRKWKVFVIHHSHTDIGYTERQEKIMRFHNDFIRQAIDVLDKIHEGRLDGASGFKWQCENYWQVRNFYERSSDEYIHKFEKYVRSGEIGLSGNYLNMTELVDDLTLASRFDLVKKFSSEHGLSITCGMTADINGFSWGYAEKLYEAGIVNFFSALHTHHGMFPLGKKLIPFWWETPSGNRILVWNGDHYHFGNELFLAPNGGLSYMDKDEFHDPFNNYRLCQTGVRETERQEEEIMYKRLTRFVENLEEEEYPYDFFPVMVSGARTDNGFPNHGIAERINKWNRQHGDAIELKMAVLEDFFTELRKNTADIPVYRGDWPDWWADGVGSTPAAVKVCRNAQRKLAACRTLDPDNSLGSPVLLENAQENIMLYCEHTWGYSSSVVQPWVGLVNDLDARKSAYAANADVAISENLDMILAAKGGSSIRYGREHRYKIINPGKVRQPMKVALQIETWEYLEGRLFNENVGFQIMDESDGRPIPYQMSRTKRFFLIEMLMELGPNEERIVCLKPVEKKPFTVGNFASIGSDGVRDILQTGEKRVDSSIIETDDFKIVLDNKTGIADFITLCDGKSILKKDRMYAPFVGIYECTETWDMIETRRKMGRNRKNNASVRYAGALKDISVDPEGDVYVLLTLSYHLEGTAIYDVKMKIFKHAPIVETSVCLHKMSRWVPENMYVYLPFCSGDDDWLYVEKTGTEIRPGVDQLPGTNQEFYLLQNGMVWQGEDKNVVLSVKDAPLIVFGNLEPHPIRLSGNNGRELNSQCVSSWVMNNFWETNFKVDLSGFYEFSYTLMVTEKENVHESFLRCSSQNYGLIGLCI